MNAVPNDEVNGPPVAESPLVTRAAPRKARRNSSRRRKLTGEQAHEVTRLYAETDTAVEAIARQFGIGQSSIYRLARQRGARRAGREEMASSSTAGVGARTPAASTATQAIPQRRAAGGPITATAESGHQPERSGVGHQFRVAFLAETVVEAADILHAISQVEAFGATDITAITREG